MILLRKFKRFLFTISPVSIILTAVLMVFGIFDLKSLWHWVFWYFGTGTVIALGAIRGLHRPKAGDYAFCFFGWLLLFYLHLPGEGGGSGSGSDWDWDWDD